MLRRLASTLGLAATTVAAFAVPLNYAQRSVPVRAGVLLIESAQVTSGSGIPANYSPFVWFNLDVDAAVKPASWNVYNPYPVSTVTPDVAARWAAISAVVGGAVPAVGTTLTKRDAPYWEIRLSQASDKQLAGYDVLLLAAHGFVSLNPLERERLRRFVDQGGILWVDANGATTFDGGALNGINGLPIPFGLNSAALSGEVPGADFSHPLLTTPNGLTAFNVASMQTDLSYGLQAVNLSAIGLAGLDPLLASLQPDFNDLLPIAWDALGPNVMLGRIGDGFVLLTSHGVATALNRGQAPDGTLLPNQQFRAQNPASDPSAWSAAKFIVNAINLGSGYTKIGQGDRGVNSTALDVGAPLLQQFFAPLSLNPGAYNYFPPAVYKGLLVVVDNSHVYVYNAKPGSGLNGDGDPSQDLQDTALGFSYDLIWVSQAMPGPISPPTCIEVPGNGAEPHDQIVVQDNNGTVHAFSAFQYDANHRIQPSGAVAPTYSVDPPNGAATNDTSVPGCGPYAPTFHEGLVFVADTTASTVGRVWVFDPANGQRLSSSGGDWVIGSSIAPVIPIVGDSPVVGYIPIQDNSGGQDRVVYVPTRPNPGVAGPTSTAGITSLWFGVRGEKPAGAPVLVNATTYQITTRASQRGLPIFLPPGDDRLGVKLTLVNIATGDPLTAAQMALAFTPNTPIAQPAPGVLQFAVSDPALVDPTLYSPRLDYTIDWGATGVANAVVRGSIDFPDDANKSRHILHGVAMSATGALYAVVSNQLSGGALSGGLQAGGSLFALREVGQGAFTLIYRYDLYPSHQITLNQASAVTYRETLFDKDPLDTTILSSFLGGPFTSLVFTSGPSIRNGVVYVTARGTKPVLGFPLDEFTILMAFKAEPEGIEIHVPRLNGGFSIVQPDMLRSPDQTVPLVFSTLQSGQFRYDATGSEQGTIRIDNLMSSTRGPITNALSTSQPIILRQNGVPDILIEPDRTGSNWSPLLQYMVVTGLKNQSPPIVTGNTVFVTGVSRLPNLISGLPVFAPPTGLVYGIRADISPTDAMLKADTDRPWMNQLYQLTVSGGNIQGNPDMLWPQTVGVTTFDDWRTRVLQTTLGGSTDSLGVIAGDGGLYAWTSNGVWGFHNADFVVCDEGRLARFDSSGNPIWTADATLNGGWYTDVGAAMNVRSLVRATKAYPIMGTTDLMVVDTGADRVMRIDAAGTELRSIEAFLLDPTYTPDGYQTNERRALRGPRDVLVYTSYESSPPLTPPTGYLPTDSWEEYWVHYVIADTGNNRVVELIDRYLADPNTHAVEGVVTYADPSRPPTDPNYNVKALGVLYWHSPASFNRKQFAYNSVSRVWVIDGANSRYVYAAGVGGDLPTRVDTGLDVPNTTSVREERSGNGGIVVFDGSNSQVINQVTVPAAAAGVYWNPTDSAFDTPAQGALTMTLTNVNSVTMRNLQVDVDGSGNFQSLPAIMFTDADGVFEIVQNGGTWQVDWMMPRLVYQVLRRTVPGDLPTLLNPVDFLPTYARRLSSGEVLIVNGYTGHNRAGANFFGEILQVDGSITPGIFGNGFQFTSENLGFNSMSVHFSLPPVQGARGIVQPVFADRR